MADIDYLVVFAVNDSWDQIKRIPNYDGVAGELLFRKIFELAPPALNMFSFGPEFVGKEEELYRSQKFKTHSKGVVKMLDAAVNMLGPDLHDVAIVLADLGSKHVEFGVLPAHYGIVGEALLHTLETALGGPDAGWTPQVKKGWTVLYAFVSTAMLAGANRRMDKIKRRKARLARVNGEPVPKKSFELYSQKRLSIPNEVLAQLGERSALTSASQSRLDELAESLRYNHDGSESGSRDDLTHTTCSTEEGEDTGGVDYSNMVETVSTSWEFVKEIPNCTEVAGVLLFKNIFEIAPQAKALFPFARSYKANDEGLFEDPAFLAHARGVVGMLDACVNLLGPDLGPVTRTLEELGARHSQYGVVDAHYPIVGEALLKTLETAMGDKWTPTVKDGWVSIFTFISSSMQNGAEDSLTHTRSSAEEVEDTEVVDYSNMVETVSTSWEFVKEIPNCTEVAGVLLFKNIFEIAPQAKALFPFARSYQDNDEGLFEDPAFLAHARGVVGMLDACVNLLGPDLEPVTRTLEELGARHAQYNVVDAHYPIVGEALLKTLETAMGDKWTPTVKDGWVSIFTFISSSMQNGAEDSLTHTRSSAEEVEDTEVVDYSNMVETVSTSWEFVKEIPNCTEVAGVLLFKNIFEIAPQAKALFPFARSYQDNDEGLFEDPAFLAHARGVVGMLDACVNLLGPDLEPVTRTLEELGARHAQYNVVDAHYPIVGEALLKTLETAMGDKWTPTVKDGWVSIFTFISSSMRNGAEDALTKEQIDI